MERERHIMTEADQKIKVDRFISSGEEKDFIAEAEGIMYIKRPSGKYRKIHKRFNEIFRQFDYAD